MRRMTICEVYSEATYTRLSIAAPGRQKVADLYGLGACVPGVYVSSSSEIARGAGVTDADVALMSTPGLDFFPVRAVVRRSLRDRLAHFPSYS